MASAFDSFNVVPNNHQAALRRQEEDARIAREHEEEKKRQIAAEKLWKEKNIVEQMNEWSKGTDMKSPSLYCQHYDRTFLDGLKSRMAKMVFVVHEEYDGLFGTDLWFTRI